MKKADKILGKYISEADMAGLGGDPMGGPSMDMGMGGTPGAKKIDDVPGDPKEKAIAAASAAVDNLKKSLLAIDELETMRDKLTKYCDNFKNGLKSKITDALAPANKPWSDDNV